MPPGRSGLGEKPCGHPFGKTWEGVPGWQVLPAGTPPQILDLLRRCLQKAQQHRLQNIAHARVEIEGARSGSRRVVAGRHVGAGGGGGGGGGGWGGGGGGGAGWGAARAR